MRNPVTSLARLSQSLTVHAKSLPLNWSVFFLLTVSLMAGWARDARAESPDTAPPQLKEILGQVDAAANRRDVQAVMQFYSANFKNSDGLTPASMQQALTELWQRYPQLNYRTELQNWTNEGNAIVAETVTRITGTQATEGMNLKLESTLRSRQRIQDQKIVSSEILAERTQLTSGANPPSIDVKLPEQVRVGQEFNFDVIVNEPLGDNLLLGTALEEPIKPDLYSKPTEFDLELLPAGGIFKVGKAPLRPEDRLISAVLIRGDGMIMVTQRLQVVDRPTASTTPSK
jgi:hypothetical protein